MSKRTIHITEFDKKRLDELISVATEFGGHARKDLEHLSQELLKARAVSPKNIPADVVTMNSKVKLSDIETGDAMTYTLVFPKDANIDAGSISVLAPVGTAILGYSKGDIIEWTVPGGVRRIRIEEVVYQPEAAGNYHL